jgi:hypothetical protein
MTDERFAVRLAILSAMTHAIKFGDQWDQADAVLAKLAEQGFAVVSIAAAHNMPPGQTNSSCISSTNVSASSAPAAIVQVL